MAKRSVVARNQKRIKLAQKQFAKRQELKKIMFDANSTDEEVGAARKKLSNLSPNGSMVRVVNRCVLTGRAHGYYRKFGISRIKLRELAHSGMLPGVTKASW